MEKNKEGITIKELLINEQIKCSEIRLVGENGEQLGITNLNSALSLSEQKGLDLVLISPSAVPPVCKIMDYGKFKFEAQKKDKEQKKKQKVVELKTIQLSITISDHDMDYRAKRTMEFADEGSKIKVNILLKGRQQAYASKGIEVMEKFAKLVEEKTFVEKTPAQEGRFINMILAPKAK